MSKDKKTTDQVEDPELDDLLNSALEDFNTDITKSTKDDIETSSAPAHVSVPEKDETLQQYETWTKEFLKQTTDQFEKNLEKFMQSGGNTDPEASFQKMADTVHDVFSNRVPADGATASVDVETSIAQALKDLSVTAENMQNDSLLSAMFNQEARDEDTSGIMPFVQGMMQSLLSKEILYPLLKDLIDKYPEWLEKNESTLSPLDTQRYKDQLDSMQQICIELEKEKEDDSEETKKGRFEKIFLLMHRMQTYGEPPAELVGNQPPLFQFDSEGNPVIPSFPAGADTPHNCCLM